jgi:long-chain acyl-CoA synthetase
VNIFDALDRSFRFLKKKTALRFEGKCFSYEELYWMALQIAQNLKQAGIGKGDRVALFLPNVPEFLTSYYAVAAVGAIAVSVNVMNKREEVSHVLSDSAARVLITTSELLSEVPSLTDIPSLRRAYAIGDGDFLPSGFAPFESLLKGGKPLTPTWENLETNDPAAILYTSGTTGRPKGAVLSHGNLVSNIFAANHHTRTTPDDVFLCFLPLFHCFGQNFIMNAAINAGACLVLHRRFDVDEVASSIGANAITRVFGVPTVFSRFLTTKDAESCLRNVPYYFSAAAALNVQIERQWREAFGKFIYQGYGMTECSPLAAYNHDFRHVCGSIGSPVENVEMKIVNEDGTAVSADTAGEILVKGPNVMLGYHNQREETAAMVRDGWLHTGDWGCQDEDGYFFLMDRVKDMINVAGFKVWPREVEEVLCRFPNVAEAAVIGVPDTDSGECVKAILVLQDSTAVTASDVVAFCAGKLARYKLPKFVEFSDNLPKNPAGKVLRKQLRLEHSQRSVVRETRIVIDPFGSAL